MILEAEHLMFRSLEIGDTLLKSDRPTETHISAAAISTRKLLIGLRTNLERKWN